MHISQNFWEIVQRRAEKSRSPRATEGSLIKPKLAAQTSWADIALATQGGPTSSVFWSFIHNARPPLLHELWTEWGRAKKSPRAAFKIHNLMAPLPGSRAEFACSRTNRAAGLTLYYAFMRWVGFIYISPLAYLRRHRFDAAARVQLLQPFRRERFSVRPPAINSTCDLIGG